MIGGPGNVSSSTAAAPGGALTMGPIITGGGPRIAAPNRVPQSFTPAATVAPKSPLSLKLWGPEGRPKILGW